MGELQVRNLTRRLEGRPLVDRVNLHVRDKEFMVLLGPERSGKTTLLRLISGLERPDSGEVWLNNTNITLLPPNERNIGMVFQSSKALQPHLTVFENIASTLRNQGLPAKGVEMQVVATAHMLGIGQQLLQRKTSMLSVEDLQRVALARVLARKAELYLFDEPLTHLDINSRHQAWQEVLIAHRLKSQSSLFVTREPREAIAFGQRVTVFGYGHVHQVGTVEELQNAPANTFVAQYINTPPLNLLHGYLQATYHQNGLRYRVLSKSFSLVLPARWNDTLQRFDAPDILLGMRASTLTPLWSQGTSQAQTNIAQAAIKEIEPHAKSSTLKLQLPGGEDLVAIVRLPPYQRLHPGQIISIGFDPEQTLLFHPLTQMLLKQA